MRDWRVVKRKQTIQKKKCVGLSEVLEKTEKKKQEDWVNNNDEIIEIASVQEKETGEANEERGKPDSMN